MLKEHENFDLQASVAGYDAQNVPPGEPECRRRIELLLIPNTRCLEDGYYISWSSLDVELNCCLFQIPDVLKMVTTSHARVQKEGKLVQMMDTIVPTINHD